MYASSEYCRDSGSQSGEESPMEIDGLGIPQSSETDFLIAALVKRLRNNEFTPEVNAVDFDDVDFRNLTREQFEECEERLDLKTIPPELFHLLLDKLIDLQAEFAGVHLEDLHLLHTIEGANPSFNNHVKHWMSRKSVREAFGVTIRPYKSFTQVRDQLSKVQQTFSNVALEKDEELCVAKINNLDPEERSLAHRAAKECSDCLTFLFQHGLVEINGYDGWGRSYFHGAIEGKNENALKWLLHELMELLHEPMELLHEPMEPLHEPMKHRENTREDEEEPIIRALKHAVQNRWLRGCELIIDHMLGAFKNLDLYFDDEIKLGLCAFVPVTLAEKLREKEIDISKVGLEGEEFTRNTTTSWHAAAAENQHGAEFMEWLDENSGSGPNVIDWQGYSPLHAAAGGVTPASVEWLCQRLLNRSSKGLKTSERSEGSGGSDSEYESETVGSESSSNAGGMKGNQLESIEIAAMCPQAHSKDIFRALVRHWASDGSKIQDMKKVRIVFEAICWGAFKAIRKEPGSKSKIVKTAAKKCQRLKARLDRKWLNCEQRKQLLERVKKYELEGLTHSMTPETR